MHRKRLNDLLEVVKGIDPKQFDQSQWECGTSACQIGHYARTYPRRRRKLSSKFDFFSFDKIAKHFDIDFEDTDSLFAFWGAEFYFCRGKRAKRFAIKRLEHFIETGEIK